MRGGAGPHEVGRLLLAQDRRPVRKPQVVPTPLRKVIPRFSIGEMWYLSQNSPPKIPQRVPDVISSSNSVARCTLQKIGITHTHANVPERLVIYGAYTITGSI